MDQRPLFRDLTAEDPDPETTIIESLCMNCHKNGSTRLLLTRIPFYKEVVLMSFSCEFCGFKNNEIQPGGEIEPKGVRINLTVKTPEDLNRRVVKSDYSSIKIVELDFEIPAQSQKGEVTTVEGVIERSASGLEQDQVVRRVMHPEAAQQIDDFVASLRDLKNLAKPFTLILEDISGNSYVENPEAPKNDPGCTVSYFNRTQEQDHELGIFTQKEVNEVTNDEQALLKPIPEGQWPLEELHGEVLTFPTNCPECGSPCDTNMKVTNIPHFKDVVIMATTCDRCGNRTSEVKSGGGIEKQGIRIEVKVRGKEDFSRDVLKSETCGLELPELELSVGSAALGGRFSTVEGLISAMKTQLADKGSLFSDSNDPEARQRMEGFINELELILTGNRSITLVLDDPAGNSYVQSLTDDGQPDEALKIIRYERNHEQNEELGLNDMITENYA